jgi:GDP-4-dehydro-6-deoxy-D-mannose reductase
MLEPGSILNLASGHAQRIGDVLQEMQAIAGVRIEVQVDRSRVRETDLQRACGDATRARKVLGWAPVIPWSVTLRDVLDDWHTRIISETGDAGT